MQGFVGLQFDKESNLADHGVRKYSAELGRFTSIDPLWESYSGWNGWQYSRNNPVNYLDKNGYFDSKFDSPNSVYGIGFDAMSEEDKEVYEESLDRFVGDFQTSILFAPFGVGFSGAIGKAAPLLSKFTGKAKDIFGKASKYLGKSADKVDDVNNIVPDRLARVIPGNLKIETLGASTGRDVFVTAADDISGLTGTQIANRLTIPQSNLGFQIIEFNTPINGIASPVFRSNAGFVGFGRTSGGAREFVIPNQVIPQGSKVRMVK